MTAPPPTTSPAPPAETTTTRIPRVGPNNAAATGLAAAAVSPPSSPTPPGSGGGAALTITVYGSPAPQGSKRHLGNGVMVESSKHVKPWREDVKHAARAGIQARHNWQPLDGPLAASAVFTFARPKGHWRTGRNAHLLRDAAPPRPAGYPDLSKVLRATEDALTAAGVWADDSRVCEYVRLAKVYVGEDPDALDVPGVVMRIWQVAP